MLAIVGLLATAVVVVGLLACVVVGVGRPVAVWRAPDWSRCQIGPRVVPEVGRV